VYKEGVAGVEVPILMLMHGGGHSGLSWGMAVKELKVLLRDTPHFIVAPDLRAHGKTYTDNDQDLVGVITSADKQMRRREKALLF